MYLCVCTLLYIRESVYLLLNIVSFGAGKNMVFIAFKLNNINSNTFYEEYCLQVHTEVLQSLWNSPLGHVTTQIF